MCATGCAFKLYMGKTNRERRIWRIKGRFVLTLPEAKKDGIAYKLTRLAQINSGTRERC